jgi:hypothetical protein
MRLIENNFRVGIILNICSIILIIYSEEGIILRLLKNIFTIWTFWWGLFLSLKYREVRSKQLLKKLIFQVFIWKIFSKISIKPLRIITLLFIKEMICLKISLFLILLCLHYLFMILVSMLLLWLKPWKLNRKNSLLMQKKLDAKLKLKNRKKILEKICIKFILNWRPL